MNVPRFSSLQEFLEWWNSREGRRLRKDPAVFKHPNIKPWFDKLLAEGKVFADRYRVTQRIGAGAWALFTTPMTRCCGL